MLCFVDESGDLSNYSNTGSKYFLCTAVLMYDYLSINQLSELRLALEHEGFPIPSGFHAKNDPRPRRKRVFDLLSKQSLYIHCVALKKEKVFPKLRTDEAFVYRIACRLLFNSLFSHFLADCDDHSIVFSNYSEGEIARRLRAYQTQLIQEFGSVHNSKRIAFWDSASNEGLQIADYCSWMIQRNLENPMDSEAVETRTLMENRIANLYKPFDD